MPKPMSVEVAAASAALLAEMANERNGWPDQDSPVADALAAQIAAMADNGRPTARAQPVRASESGKCGRQIAYAILSRAGRKERPPDPIASIAVMHIGTMVHEQWFDRAMLRHYGPNVDLEVGWELPLYQVSGHADAVAREGSGLRAIEFKTGNGTYYRKAVLGGQGPRRSAVLQAGLNGLGTGASLVTVAMLGTEGIGVDNAARNGMDPFDPLRIVASWTWTREQFEPGAHLEGARLRSIAQTVAAGGLPERRLESGRIVEDPMADSAPWECSYCAYRAQCVEDGGGEPATQASA